MRYLDVSRKAMELKIVFSAEIENIDAVCWEAKNFLHTLNIQRNFEVILPLREALMNAVTHGCKEVPHKRIICEISMDEFHIVIRVKDRGNGFDWQAINSGVPKVDQMNGRGISIMKHYCSNVKFNEKGNEVVITKNVLALMGV